jgi:hypothetical protein
MNPWTRPIGRIQAGRQPEPRRMEYSVSTTPPGKGFTCLCCTSRSYRKPERTAGYHASIRGWLSAWKPPGNESEAAEVALEDSRDLMDNFPVLYKSSGLRHGFPSPRFSKILQVPRNQTNCHRTQDTMAEQSRNGSPPFRKTTCSYDKVPGRGTIPAKPYLQELGSEVLLGKKQPAHRWRKKPVELAFGGPPKPIHEPGT